MWRNKNEEKGSAVQINSLNWFKHYLMQTATFSIELTQYIAVKNIFFSSGLASTCPKKLSSNSTRFHDSSKSTLSSPIFKPVHVVPLNFASLSNLLINFSVAPWNGKSLPHTRRLPAFFRCLTFSIPSNNSSSVALTSPLLYLPIAHVLFSSDSGAISFQMHKLAFGSVEKLRIVVASNQRMSTLEKQRILLELVRPIR